MIYDIWIYLRVAIQNIFKIIYFVKKIFLGKQWKIELAVVRM